MRRIFPLLVLSAAAAFSTPAFAQPGKDGPNPVGAVGPLDTEKVKLVYVYGDDPCPAASKDPDEIVICAKLPDNERYRIPKELRDDKPIPAQNQSWVNRTAVADDVSRRAAGLPDTCSPTGSGGQTG